MKKAFLSSSVWRRLAALVALLAMALLLWGPLVTHCQAHAQHVSTALDSGPMLGCHGEPSAVAHKTHVPGKPWYEQCGYCSLWHHFPASLSCLPQSFCSPLAMRVVTDLAVRACPPDQARYSAAFPRAPPGLPLDAGQA